MKKASLTTLGKICREDSGMIQSGPFGSQLHAYEYVEHGVAVVMPKDIEGGAVKASSAARISESTARRLIRHKLVAGDIVFPRRGDIAKCALIKQGDEFICGTGCLKIRIPSDIAVSVYVYYYLNLNSSSQWLELNSVGSTMKNLSAKIFKRFPIRLPSKDHQQEIASILSAYDDLIENNLRRIKLLEELAQQTYEEWFVRMRFPGYETAAWDEGTGLPVGWGRVRFSTLATVVGGGTPSRNTAAYWENGTIDWYSPTDLSKSGALVQLQSSEQISELGLAKSSAKLMQPNSFMMTSRATIGLFALSKTPYSTNQGFINVAAKDKASKGYLFMMLKNYIPLLLNYATGTTFLEISKTNLKAIKFVYPCKDILKKYDAVFENTTEIVGNLIVQNQILREARDLLLPRLMSGEVDIDAIKAHV